MAYTCAECGKVHDDLPRFFMWRLPETTDKRTLAVTEDRKSMCRSSDGRFFVHCEVEIPVEGRRRTVLGFICWVEVLPPIYEQLLLFRESKSKKSPFKQLVEGRLANPVHGIRESYGTKVKFKVIASDPTPYIKWAPAGSSLGRRMRAGATAKFWHHVAAEVLGTQHG